MTTTFVAFRKGNHAQVLKPAKSEISALVRFLKDNGYFLTIIRVRK
jgi:hypothetical protein